MRKALGLKASATLQTQVHCIWTCMVFSAAADRGKRIHLKMFPESNAYPAVTDLKQSINKTCPIGQTHCIAFL